MIGGTKNQDIADLLRRLVDTVLEIKAERDALKRKLKRLENHNDR